MYFCYNLEKEEGSLKTELKNCLSLYKIFYSCAFILILCAIHPIIYYEEIGSAIQSPIAFLTIIFCSDTYLMEVKSKRADVFHLYDQKKQLKVISQRVGVQILYLKYKRNILNTRNAFVYTARFLPEKQNISNTGKY